MRKGFTLKAAIAQALGIATLAGLSPQVSAINISSTATVSTPQAVISAVNLTKYRSWGQYGMGGNYGNTHMTTYQTFQVGTVEDIAAGKRFDINIDIKGMKLGTIAALANPAFTLWTSGTAPIETPTASQLGYGHSWNQVRGAYDGGNAGFPCDVGADTCAMGSNGWLATDFTANDGGFGNIVPGHDGWIGYANSGYAFKNGDNDYIQGRLAGYSNPTNKGEYGDGGYASVGGPVAGSALTNVNTTSSWVDGGNALLAAGEAGLNLTGLKAGYYLIAVGEICPDKNLNGQDCNSTARGVAAYQMTIKNFGETTASAVVPLPSTAWLFVGSLFGYLGWQRRKITVTA